jgi:hypothetical protein
VHRSPQRRLQLLSKHVFGPNLTGSVGAVSMPRQSCGYHLFCQLWADEIDDVAMQQRIAEFCSQTGIAIQIVTEIAVRTTRIAENVQYFPPRND